MLQPDFNKMDGLLPVVVQDAQTDKVLMVGFMNLEAYKKTTTENRVTFYSRTKQRLWTKGETSGHYLEVVQILLDCDQDTLLIKAKPLGPVCHTGSDTCFNEINKPKSFLNQLETLIQDRKSNPTDSSYTVSLFKKGTAKIAQKVGEEAVETVIEAMKGDKELLKNEASDLVYHLLVLLADQGLSLKDIEQVLEGRHKK